MDKSDITVTNYFKGSGTGTFTSVFKLKQSKFGKQIKPEPAEDSFAGLFISGKPVSREHYQLLQNLHNKLQMICD